MKSRKESAELKSNWMSWVKAKQKQKNAEGDSDQIKALETDFEKIESKQREWIDMDFQLILGLLKELDKQLDEMHGQTWRDCKQTEDEVSGTQILNRQMPIKIHCRSNDEESQKLERTNGRYSSYNNFEEKVEEYQMR